MYRLHAGQSIQGSFQGKLLLLNKYIKILEDFGHFMFKKILTKKPHRFRCSFFFLRKKNEI